MYARGTILTLKAQKDPDPETGEPFPYNQVEVVGPSPVSHTASSGDWEGPEAAGVIVQPVTNFGSTLDEPFGKLTALYDVESIPEPEVITDSKVRVIDAHSAQAGPTPEEVFKAEAPGAPPEEGQRRARTSSPLGDVRNEAVKGPLGDGKPEVAPAPEPEPTGSPLD